MKRELLTLSALLIAISLCACNDTGNGNGSTLPPAQTTLTQTENMPEQSAPSASVANQEKEPEWWGEYKNDEAFSSISVSNFNGTSFRFDMYFLRDGSLLTDGVAAIISDDMFSAEYEDFTFVLSDDFNSIEVSVPESSEWSHLSGSYNRINSSFSPTLNAGLEGFVWKIGNEYTLDEEVLAYIASLPEGSDIKSQIESYLSFLDSEVSEWVSCDEDGVLSGQIGYPVWVAEYYIGNEEDTRLCLDAVVQAGEWENADYTLILHTVRDADLDMNSDIDYDARIRELFETIVVTAATEAG